MAFKYKMSVISYIKDVLREGFRDIVRDIGEDVNVMVLRKLNQIRKQIIKDIFGILVIIIGVGLLGISAVFFLIEYLTLNKTLSFLIIGVVVLFIGIIIKIMK